MWQFVFIIYIIFSLIMTSTTSIMLRGVAGVENILYYNNILLVISVAFFSSVVTMNVACSSSIQSHLVVLALILLNLITTVITSLILADPQFVKCPPVVKNALIANLVLNILPTVSQIIYYVKERDMSAMLPSL